MSEPQATGTMMLMPPPEGHCRICAVKHEPHVAHNAQSLFYQMRFRMRYRGKMWKAKRDGKWWLRWYGEHLEDDMIEICTREILLS